jgi:hypothetical protein
MKKLTLAVFTAATFAVAPPAPAQCDVVGYGSCLDWFPARAGDWVATVLRLYCTSILVTVCDTGF